MFLRSSFEEVGTFQPPLALGCFKLRADVAERSHKLVTALRSCPKKSEGSLAAVLHPYSLARKIKQLPQFAVYAATQASQLLQNPSGKADIDGGSGSLGIAEELCAAGDVSSAVSLTRHVYRWLFSTKA